MTIKNSFKKTPCIFIFTSILMISCEKIAVVSEDYMDCFELEEKSVPFGDYLEVVSSVPISKKDVEDKVIGHGWESSAIYEMDADKNVIQEINIVSDDSVQDVYNVSPHRFEVTGFGENQLIEYGIPFKAYEKHSFEYDESDNSLTLLACLYIGSKGKIVYLSRSTMVCVAGSKIGLPDRDPAAYMVIFKKVSHSTVLDWREKCPYSGLWI